MSFSHKCKWAKWKWMLRTIFAAVVGVTVIACATDSSWETHAKNIYNYVDPTQEVVAIQIVESRALVWLSHSDLTLEGTECSDNVYFCIALPFSATVVIPRKPFDFPARQWSSRGVICDLASTNELQRLQIVCTDREGSSTTRVDYVPSRGVERIELLKTPPGFERWTKVSPLTLKSKARGLFGQ